jgi:N-glycosylase/DNA lyase
MWNKMKGFKKGSFITTKELNLKNTLMNGQCFNWKQFGNIYIGTVNNNVIALKEETDIGTNFQNIYFKFLHKNILSTDKKFEENFFKNYFQLQVDLDHIYSEAKSNFTTEMKKTIDKFPGLRIIKQDLFECIISFICSANNNIERIRKMIEQLRVNYGQLLYEDKEYGKFYSFPTVQELCLVTEKELNDFGFGYRSAYIVKTMQFLKKEENFLIDLPQSEDPASELLKLHGVGRKVADCILLFSLEKHHIVPLDVHMINFFNETVVKTNKAFKKIESLTKNSYTQVSINYFETFGKYAGWYHSIFYMSRISKTHKNNNPKNRAKSVQDSKKKEKSEKVENLSEKSKNGKRTIKQQDLFDNSKKNKKKTVTIKEKK